MCSQYNDTMYDSLSIWRDVMSLALSLVTFERASLLLEWNSEMSATFTFWHIGTLLKTIDCANFTLKFDSLDSLGRLSIVRSAAPADANAFIHFLRTHEPPAHSPPRPERPATRVVAPAVHEKYE